MADINRENEDGDEDDEGGEDEGRKTDKDRHRVVSGSEESVNLRALFHV